MSQIKIRKNQTQNLMKNLPYATAFFLGFFSSLLDSLENTSSSLLRTLLSRLSILLMLTLFYNQHPSLAQLTTRFPNTRFSDTQSSITQFQIAIWYVISKYAIFQRAIQYAISQIRDLLLRKSFDTQFQCNPVCNLLVRNSNAQLSTSCQNFDLICTCFHKNHALVK